MSQTQRMIKIVVVGDGAVGKTCLLISFTENRFPDKYVPTIFDNSSKVVTYKPHDHHPGTKVELDLWDTAGQEEFDRIRYLSYRDTHVFFFCYSCVDPDSFQNISSKWLPEVNYHMRNANPTKMLVGLKCDLLEDKKTLDELEKNGKTAVVRSTVEAYAEKNGMGFMEVSALKSINVE